MKLILRFVVVYRLVLAGLGNQLSLFLLNDFLEDAFSSSRLQTKRSIYVFR